jgi:excisionase family DNA binding protein
MASPELLDKKAAADYLNVGERYVDRLWSERRIAGHKYGKVIRFAKSDLDAFLAATRTEAVR